METQAVGLEQLGIVFYDQDEPTTKAATLIFVCEGGTLNPESFDSNKGLSISEFFKGRGFSIEEYMEMFPGYVVPDTRKEERITELAWDGKVREYVVFPLEQSENQKISWDSHFVWQRLPGGQAEMQRLANRLNLKISVFSFFRRQDRVPQFCYEVIPNEG